MPAAQTLLPRLNALATREVLTDMDPGLFEPGRSLVESLEALEVFRAGDPELFTQYVQSIPSGIQESIRALVFHNIALRADGPIGMTFAWAPAYDWELRVWEAAGTAQTPGGITVLLCSRYPGDSIPTAIP